MDSGPTRVDLLEAEQAILGRLVIKDKIGARRVVARTLGLRGAATLDSSLQVSGNTKLQSGLQVGQHVTVAGMLLVHKRALLGPLAVSGCAVVEQDCSIGGNTTLEGELFVSGNVDVMQDLLVSGSADVRQDLSVAGRLTVQDRLLLQELLVSGDSTLEGNLCVKQDAGVRGQLQAGELLVQGSASVAGELDIAGSVRVQRGLECASVQCSQPSRVGQLDSTGVRVAGSVVADSVATTDLTVRNNVTVSGQVKSEQTETKRLQCESVQTGQLVAQTASFSHHVTTDGRVAAHTVQTEQLQVTQDVHIRGKGHILGNLQTGNIAGHAARFQQLQVESGFRATGRSNMDILQAGRLHAKTTKTDTLQADSCTLQHCSVSRLETSSIGLPPDTDTLTVKGRLQVDSLSTRLLDTGSSVTVPTSVNILGDLTATGCLQGQLLPSLTLTFLSAHQLHADHLLPSPSATALHYGKPSCNHVFEDRISVPSLYVNQLHGNGSDSVKVKPHLQLQGHVQTSLLRTTQGDVMRWENSRGQPGLALDLTQCQGGKKQVNASSVLSAPVRLELTAVKTKTVQVHNTLQTGHISSIPGGKLCLEAHTACLEHVQPLRNTTLSFHTPTGRKRGQLNVGDKGLVLQAVDGGPLTLKARSSHVSVPNKLETDHLCAKTVQTQQLQTDRAAVRQLQTSHIVCDQDSPSLQLGPLQLHATDSRLLLQSKPLVCKQLTTVTLDCGSLEAGHVGADSLSSSSVSTHRLQLEAGSHLQLDSAVKLESCLTLQGDLVVEGSSRVQDVLPDRAGLRQLGSSDTPFLSVYAQQLQIGTTLSCSQLVTGLIRGPTDSVTMDSTLCVRRVATPVLYSQELNTDVCCTNFLDLPAGRKHLVVRSDTGQPLLSLSRNCVQGAGRLRITGNLQLLGNKACVQTGSTLTLQAKQLDIQAPTVMNCSLQVSGPLLTPHLMPRFGDTLLVGCAQGSVIVPKLDADEVDATALKADFLQLSVVEPKDGRLYLCHPQQLQQATLSLLPDQVKLSIEQGGLDIDSDVTVQGELHVKQGLRVDLLHTDHLQIGHRFSIASSSLPGCPTTLTAEDAQVVALDTYELRLPNNLRAAGTLYTDRLWPCTHDNQLELGKTDTFIQLRDKVATQQLTTDKLETAHATCQQLHTGSITPTGKRLVIHGDAVVRDLMVNKLNTPLSGLHVQCKGGDLHFKVSDRESRIAVGKGDLVLAAERVRAVGDMAVTQKLQASELTVMKATVQKLTVNQLDSSTGQVAVNSSVQLCSGLQGKDNLLPLLDSAGEERLCWDTTSVNPAIRSKGGLRLCTDGPMVAVERALRTQDLQPDVSTRTLGTATKPYQAVHAQQYQSPAMLLSSGNGRVRLNAETLETSHNQQLTLQTPAGKDIKLAPGSGRVVLGGLPVFSLETLVEADSNGEAAEQGVPVGGLYRKRGDPAILCVRTNDTATATGAGEPSVGDTVAAPTPPPNQNSAAPRAETHSGASRI